VANEDKIPMVSVHDEMGPLEEMIELGDGVNNGEAFQFLNLPTSLHVRQTLGDELYGSKLGVNNLEENRANARSGGVGVEIDGVAIVQIEILDRAANEGLQSVEGGSGVFSVNHVSGSTSREELGQPLGVVRIVRDEITKEVAESEERPEILLGEGKRNGEKVGAACWIMANPRSVRNKSEEFDVRTTEVALRALENNAVALELLEHEPQTRQKFRFGRSEHYDVVDEDVADDPDEALQNHFRHGALEPGGGIR